MLGIAVGTCKAQLHRARQLLGARMQLGEESAMNRKLDEAARQTLPRDVPPDRDLWPAIAARLEPAAVEPPRAVNPGAGRGRSRPRSCSWPRRR